MKTADNYLPENFTIEFDFLPSDGSYKPGILFSNGNEGTGEIFFGKDVSTSYFPKDFSGVYPGDQEHFDGKWHHAAMIRKGFADKMLCGPVPGPGDAGCLRDKNDPLEYRRYRQPRVSDRL